MRLGVFGVGVGAMASAEAGPLAALAEDLGYASLWTGEHMVVPRPRPGYFPREPEWPFADPVVQLAYLAAHTSRVALGTGVLVLPQRHPVHLAKELATLDVLSRGRLLAGLGVGHLEVEMAALGVPMTGRGERSMEYLAAMRSLWRDPEPRFAGAHVSFAGVDAHPRPYRPGGPTVVLGGAGPAALRRAAEHADGWYGWGQTPAEAARCRTRIREHADRAGRRLDGFRIWVTPLRRLDRALVDAYAGAGVDEIVLSAESGDLDAVRRKLERNRPEVFGLG